MRPSKSSGRRSSTGLGRLRLARASRLENRGNSDLGLGSLTQLMDTQRYISITIDDYSDKTAKPDVRSNQQQVFFHDRRDRFPEPK